MVIDINDKKTQGKLATRFITALLELGGHLRVDGDTGIISYKDNPEVPITIKVAVPRNTEKEERVLTVYKPLSTIKNSVMLNPFIEQIGANSSERIWFYSITNRIHTVAFSRTMELIIENLVKSSKGETLDDPKLLGYLATVVGSFDVKTEKELSAIIKKIPTSEQIDDTTISEGNAIVNSADSRDFISIVRKVKEGKASLTSFLQDPEDNFKTKFGTRVRKKTFKLVENIFKTLYGVQDMSNPLIESISDSSVCPSFLSYCEVLVASWNKMIPYLKHLYGEDEAEATIAAICTIEDIMPYIDVISKSALWATGGTINDPTLAKEDTTTNSKVEKPRRGRPPKVRIKDVELEDDVQIRTIERTSITRGDVPFDPRSRVEDLPAKTFDRQLYSDKDPSELISGRNYYQGHTDRYYPDRARSEDPRYYSRYPDRHPDRYSPTPPRSREFSNNIEHRGQLYSSRSPADAIHDRRYIQDSYASEQAPIYYGGSVRDHNDHRRNDYYDRGYGRSYNRGYDSGNKRL